MVDRGLTGQEIGHYRIGEMLGQGGMAAVYEATDLKLERKVALKLMHPHLASQKSFQQRFLHEARAAASLDHPNIVRVLSFKNLDDTLFLVMELITGGNLRQYIKQLHEEAKFIDYPEAIELIQQLADALDYAHQQGMVHRDIKPDNIILKPQDSSSSILNYRPLITDFGLAKLTYGDEEAVTDQQPIGTYPYMSPEQCLAEGVDARSDIYSLGVMLYELTVGRLPYTPKSIAEAARMHGREPLTLPSALRRGFPSNLEAIIVKALAKDTINRYQSMTEMAIALQSLQKSETTINKRSTTSSAVVPVEQELITDKSTALMEEPLPEDVPDFEPPPLSDEQMGFDRLIFYSEEHPNFAVKLAADVFTIGRDEGQDIVLRGEKVSRQHIQLERKPNGKYYIIDTGSSNGSWIGNKQLESGTPMILRFDSIARVGDYWMQLEQKQEIIAEEEVVEEIIPEEKPAAFNLESQPAEEIAKLVAEYTAANQLEGHITEQIAPVKPEEMPYFSPPHVPPDQMGYARLVFFGTTHSTITAKLDQDTLSIGRSETQDIILPGRGVSRRHARIEHHGEGLFYLIDVGSTNGTWINGERLDVNLPTIITANQTIRLGNYWVKFEAKRDIQMPMMPGFSPVTDTAQSQLDANATVAMIGPIHEEIPHFSPPPMTIEQQASDRLTLFSEDHPLQIVMLDKERIKIGRGEDQDVILNGKRVSRYHLLLECKPDGHIYITDQSSTNGTWVGNTLLVAETQALWASDEIIRLGNYWMKFEQGNRGYSPFAVGSLDDSRGLIGLTIKDFSIDRFLGQNSITAVYKATELSLNRPVALKIMHPNLAAQPAMKQRFLQEARAASRLDHPNIVRVLSYDDIENELFMVMELILGGSLRVYLNQLKEQSRHVDFAEAIDMSIQMSDGLHYAHQQGMIHRDIRPETVVLKSGVVVGPIVKYQPVLTDFALARTEESGKIFITDKPDISFGYMSPEQALGKRVDIRSDIYEMGVILYEMITGDLPHEPRSMTEAVRMHSRGVIQPPSEMRPDIPHELSDVIVKALEKEANDRYQTASELSRALQRINLDGELDGEAAVFSGRSLEEQATVVMDAPLPAQMPSVTHPPITIDQEEHDRLVIYSDNYPTRGIPLGKDVLTVGREKNQDVMIDSPLVSQRHARIERGFEGTYRIVDIGSKNGSWLGNYRLIPNVAEIWDASETVRIGDCWLRIEKLDDFSDIVDYHVQEYSTDAGQEEQDDDVVPDILQPVLGQDKIKVTVDNQHISVALGSSVAIAIEVANQSTVVDHFTVTIEGLPPEWVTQPSHPLYLMPHDHDTTSAMFHPPLASSSNAGEHAFEVRVSTRAQNIYSVAAQGTLTIEPYRNFVSDLQPARVKGRGLAELTITNKGNSPSVFSIQARDREQGIRFNVIGKQFTLPPGYTERIPIRMAPKSRPFLGSPQTLPFEVDITPTPEDEAGGVQIQSGELVVKPRFPIWTISIVIILLMLCGIISFFELSATRRKQPPV
jgi:serine/threonine protein kinase